MLTLPPAVQVFVATQPYDLRKSFDGLSLAVTHELGQDPLSGHLYCFFNKRATQVRVLFWDRTGWCIIAKRLAQGRFHLLPVQGQQGASVQLPPVELSLILEGLELTGAVRHKRYQRVPVDTGKDDKH
jgi:transposase